jgi:hypothetical protein
LPTIGAVNPSLTIQAIAARTPTVALQAANKPPWRRYFSAADARSPAFDEM